MEGKGRGGVAPLPGIPGSAPKLVLQVQRPLLPRSSPAGAGLGRQEPPQRLSSGAPGSHPPTWRVHFCTEAAGAVGGGLWRGAAFRARGGQAEARLAGRWGELSGRGTEPRSRGAHVTAVCFGRGSCRGQCKGVTPERAGAGVRGETRNERGAGGGCRGPGQSRPVTATLAADACIGPAGGAAEPGGQEVRDTGEGPP